MNSCATCAKTLIYLCARYVNKRIRMIYAAFRPLFTVCSQQLAFFCHNLRSIQFLAP